jgi:hypothetical protein
MSRQLQRRHTTSRRPDCRRPVLRTRRARRDDAGFALVTVAILFTVILVCAALAIDGGSAYQSHRQSQNASDAGAMAGANAINQLNFFPVCSPTQPPPCSGFTNPSAVRTETVREAHDNGADTSPGGVTCWLTDANDDRFGNELCDSGQDPTAGQVAAASGVEVHTRVTRPTIFAGVFGTRSTAANTMAKASVGNFGGGTGSPFIVCGVRPGSGGTLSSWYNLLTPDGAGGYKFTTNPDPTNSGPVGLYYQIQGAQNPDCGNGSGAFKGKGDGKPIPSLPATVGITAGNGFENQIRIAVAGITPCPAGATTFDGCGMLIPIADASGGTGSNTTMHIVAWLAFMVWGDGTGRYPFIGSNQDPLGASCLNPITAGGGSMKYCGKLLGAATATGGNSSGPGTAGQIHIVRLVA